MKRNKPPKSLKKRIMRSFNILNFSGLIILFVMVSVVMGSLFGVFSSLLSQSVANQIAMALSLNDKFEYKRMGDPYSLIDTTANHAPGIENKRLNLIRYFIYKSNQLVYDSLNEESEYSAIIKSLDSKTLLQFINQKSEAVLMDPSKKPIGTVVVELNPLLVYMAYLGLIIVFAVGIIVIFLLSQLGVRLLGPVLIRPIEELEKKMGDMASGNIEAAIHTTIAMKKPVLEVQTLANHANAILSMMHHYVGDLEQQKQLVQKHNEKLHHIMDQVDQGIFQINEDLIIDHTYSQEAERLFGKPLGGLSFPDLLYSPHAGDHGFLKDVLSSLFTAKSLEQEVYRSLLPEEVTYEGKVISLRYKMVMYEDHPSLMILLTDLTNQRALEHDIEEEQVNLKMVVKALIYADALRMLIKSYEAFCEAALSLVSEGKVPKLIREIHTFKGSFAQYDWKHTQDQLNELEVLLEERPEGFEEALTYEVLMGLLEKDHQKIRDHVGVNFKDESPQCLVDREKILRIEDRIIELLSPEEQNEILPLVRELRYVSLKTYLAQYEDYLGTLSMRLEKSILLGAVSGDEVFIDPERYDPVLRHIVHLVRNAADHGIEEDVERLEMDKPLPAIIQFQVEQGEDWTLIRLMDDGRGISYEALKAAALKKGYTEDQLEGLPKEEWPFLEGVSSKEEATVISGRGVGLSAVREAIAQFGGSLMLESVWGQGTTYTIRLPIQKNQKDMTSSHELMEGLTETVDQLIGQRFGIELVAQPMSYLNSIVLDEATAIVHLKGTLNLIVMISITKKLLEGLKPHMIFYEVGPSELEALLEDLLSELSNTLLGNALRAFDSKEDIFHLGIPVIMSHTEGYIKYSQDTIMSRRFERGEMALGVHLIPIHSEFIVKRFEEENAWLE